MVPSVETTYISSSVVREVAQHHGNLEGLVHPAIAKALADKFADGPAARK
jgi:pantetheine-phosphate adenylyltransferase